MSEPTTAQEDELTTPPRARRRLPVPHRGLSRPLRGLDRGLRVLAATAAQATQRDHVGRTESAVNILTFTLSVSVLRWAWHNHGWSAIA